MEGLGLAAAYVKEDAHIREETLQLPLDRGRHVLPGAPDMRVEQMVSMTLVQRQLGHVTAATKTN